MPPFCTCHSPSNAAGPERRAWLRRCGAAAVVALGGLAGAAWAEGVEAGGDAAVYRFSPVNQYGIALTAAYWNPIIAHVAEKSGIKLQMKIGRTSADTTAYVLAQEVEFAFTNHLFSPEREQLGWRVFGRRQVPPMHAQIIVMADSPVKDLSQLQGKEVAFAGPEALVSYKFNAAQLLARKVDFKTVFGGNSDGSLAQLWAGKVAAAGVNSQLAEGYARREGKAYRVLWSSAPVHDLPLVVSSKVPEKVQKAVARAFIGMHDDPAGREILHQASTQVGLTAEAYFVASDGSEYGAFREFFRTAPASLR
jgi:phosphonate transport system substrate-binding protein